MQPDWVSGSDGMQCIDIKLHSLIWSDSLLDFETIHIVFSESDAQDSCEAVVPSGIGVSLTI